nr:RNaseH domain of reverse transcriptase [Drepanopeziza brunnea f. sp. 'multigermtubi']
MHAPGKSREPSQQAKACTLDRNIAMLRDDVNSIIEWGNTHKIAFAPEKIEMMHFSRKKGTLARTVHGPSAASLRKAVTTCVLPSVLYGTEAWYAGRYRPICKSGRPEVVSARVGGMVDLIDKTITLAARGVLPVWRTTPTATLFRDAGLLSGTAALEEAKARFAMRLKTVDDKHPLVSRIPLRIRQRGRGAGTTKIPETKIQRLGTLFPDVPRPRLVPPHFTSGSRRDPADGKTKKEAAAAFEAWWQQLPPEDITIFSDGSEQYDQGNRLVGYGYVVYRGRQETSHGYGSINDCSYVFDAEAIGAWKGLERVVHAYPTARRIWLCIDSTSVIWVMETRDVRIRWSLGHMGIKGNERADKLADLGARKPDWDTSLASQLTISGIRTLFRDIRDRAREAWWSASSLKLLRSYRKWGLPYLVKPLPELELLRHVLHRLLAIRTTHGDFTWYYTRFQHHDANLRCACGKRKSPLHIAFCRFTQRRFFSWPHKTRPRTPPSTIPEAYDFLKGLLNNPADFQAFLTTTEFYSKHCTR